MPRTTVVAFKEDSGKVPFLAWFSEVKSKDIRAAKRRLRLLRMLRDVGHELRRPQADYLRDGVYELRARVGRVNYRILYGFVGKNAALVSHGITKERAVPSDEIDRAVDRLAEYRQDPANRSATFEDI